MAKTLLMVPGFLALATCGAAHAQLGESAVVQIDIVSQPLDKAVGAWAAQTGYQVLIPSGGEAVSRMVAAVKGSYPPSEALEALLANSGIRYQFINTNTVALTDNIHLAQASSGPAAAPSGERTSRKMEEVVVTAQKRTERLQDVPLPVTAISADTLAENNQLRLQDYYSSVPGLSLTPEDFRGASVLTIRGLTTGGFTNPTVGIVVDDVPYGASTQSGGGEQAPDIDPSELARVEILRGPQGTLYGASSIGGLLKFVTTDPSTTGFAGRVQAGVSGVKNGGDLGYNVRGSVNIPLGDTFALRASGFTRRDPGYIDIPAFIGDPAEHADAVNQVDVHGGRLAGLWRPSDIFSLRLNALLQNTDADGSPYVHVLPGLADLEQSALKGTGRVKRKSQVYNATINVKLGTTNLTAISGYSINRLSDIFDFTPGFGTFTLNGFNGFPGFGVEGTPLFERYKTTKFSQEVRLDASIGKRVEWLLGAFYTDERSRFENDFLAVNPTTGALGPITGSWLHTDNPNKFSEYAVFADLTFNITDQFDVQIGGRESKNRQSSQNIQIGPFVPAFVGVASPNVSPNVHTDGNSFTYLVTPRLRFSEDMMLYARLASGYRPGGPNLNLAAGVPSDFGPDKTQNYEVGIKGTVLDSKLSFDASVYYIDWKDIQIELRQPLTGAAYVANGSRAKSQGIELSGELRPVNGLAVTGWVAWNAAELSDDFPASSSAVGDSGDRLPYSARFSANLSVDQDFPLTSTFSGFAGGTVSYVGNRQGVFSSVFAVPPERQTFPSYTRADLRTGVRSDTWTANLFVNNLTDRRGVLTGGIGTTPSFGFVYIQPRTIGLSVSRNF